MYEAAKTGVIKINRLSPEFFKELFAVNSPADVQKLFVKNWRLFQSLIADESLPIGTRKMIRDLHERAIKGKLNETNAMKAIPLFYSMTTRGGGNSMISWTVFNREGIGDNRFSKPRNVGDYADYNLEKEYLKIGNEYFDLLDKSGNQVLTEMTAKLTGGKVIPWARVDYRTARPIDGKHTFAIVDVGMGNVGTFEKDTIAKKFGLNSHISRRLLESLLHYHVEHTGAKPKKVIIALSEDYFDKNGNSIVKNRYDLEGIQEMFRRELGSHDVFVVPYSRLNIENMHVAVSTPDGRKQIERNDLVLVYNPNKPMHEDLERQILQHTRIIESREFAVISDKRNNNSFFLAAKAYSKHGRVIVPERGPLITANTQEELHSKLRGIEGKFGRSGAVVKLPRPIEVDGKALPSALFFNPQSEFQTKAMVRALNKHWSAGARTFVTEELIHPHSVDGKKGGLEIRLYYGSKNNNHRR